MFLVCSSISFVSRDTVFNTISIHAYSSHHVQHIIKRYGMIRRVWYDSCASGLDSRWIHMRANVDREDRMASGLVALVASGTSSWNSIWRRSGLLGNMVVPPDITRSARSSDSCSIELELDSLSSCLIRKWGLRSMKPASKPV